MRKTHWSRLQLEIASWSLSAFALILLVASSLLIIGGIGAIAFQGYYFLLHGDWLSFSLVDGLNRVSNDWASDPDTWLGFWKILNSLPLSIALVAAGLAAWIAFVKISLAAWNANDRLKALNKDRARSDA